jgi:chemotaxis protein CheZ
MENAENIDEIVAKIKSKLPEGDPDSIEADVEKLEFVSMELITACSFQDLTGQRINTVVNTLSYVEERLQKLIDIWRIEHGEIDLPKSPSPRVTTGKRKR